SNASPIVSVLTHRAAYGDLCLDITGVTHLFGGEAAMLERLTGRLRALGYTVNGAIAGSIGAACALAVFAPGSIIEDDPEPALARVPMTGLRIDADQVNGLEQMGLRFIGQLYQRDRRALAARFGSS